MNDEIPDTCLLLQHDGVERHLAEVLGAARWRRSPGPELTAAPAAAPGS